MTLNIVAYEVGKFYRVPVVRGIWCGRLGDWPILGPWHEDAGIIGFPEEHFHIDGRFIPQREFRLQRDKIPQFFISPLTKNVTDRNFCTHPLQPLGLRRRKCQRLIPDYPQRPEWLTGLEAAYAQASIVPALVCPHRGAPLQGLAVKDGCVTCPLHGLRWSIKTGRLSATPILTRQ